MMTGIKQHEDSIEAYKTESADCEKTSRTNKNSEPPEL